jgi:ribosomal-protein-alanine N-acetyltransferase
MSVTLTTARLTLRPYRLSDVDDVFGRTIDPEFSRFLALPQPYDRSDAERFIAQAVLRPWQTHPTFAVDQDGAVIGDVNLRVDLSTATASVGYGVDSRYWNRGFTTEAAAAVFAWAFHDLGLVRIEATADSENVGSWRVMEKLGMRREGLLRKHRVLRGEHRDTVIYAILADDWTPRSQ